MTAAARKNNVDRRQQITDVAIEIFHEFGYQKASLRDIGRRVGVTQAAIYYHFRNKEEILYSIIEDTSRHLLLSLLACTSQNKDPVDKLTEAITTHIGLMKTERKKVKILIEDKRLLGDELQALVKEKEKTIYRLYRDLLQEIKDRGRLKDIEMTTAVFGIIGQINWLYHWYRPKGEMPMDQITESMVKMILFGLVRD